MEKFTCAMAKQICIVDYLNILGYQPQKIRNNDYWYLSPLREENTASFKVNRKLNVWYDHATGKGGDLIDFGTQYFKCSISELLQRLSASQVQALSFQPPLPPHKLQNYTNLPAKAQEENPESKIKIFEVQPLKNRTLLDYLDERHVSLAAALPHCREVDFLLYGKQYTVIGFSNNAGGYELRSAAFKGSSSPKGATLIDAESKELTVFKGFFNFLSFQTLNQKQGVPPIKTPPSFLILNSLSFFEKICPVMEKHDHVNLYLDRNTPVSKPPNRRCSGIKNKYKDRSYLYDKHEDLNAYLKHRQQNLPPRKRIRRSI